MTAQAKRRTLKVLLVACGVPATVSAFRSFYFQELFFAFLLFAIVFLILLLMAGAAVGVWMLYARAVVYLATRTARQGQRALPAARATVLWLAPTVIRSAGAVSSAQQILFYPFSGPLRGWLRSFRLDASHFREDTERAVKHLRLLLKQS
ncbi:MAG: hypothetical protein DMG37_09580 [Acidobacteria bacterium]|nr:MAG: hypothetical protein DMG37_09580 [Acidobacteriota bacterium]